METLYKTIYEKGLFSDHWFIYQGKPLLLADEGQMPEHLKGFFTLRLSWAWSSAEWFGDGHHKWCWLDDTPRNFGWDENSSVPEQVSVTTAQHPTTNKGKSYHNGAQPETPQSEKGLYFAEQWESALKTNPKILMITQWNEWVAIRFKANKEMFGTGDSMLQGFRKIGYGDDVFVDVLNEEYNRDIEPMRGGWGDNYYCQMVNGIRRFKGVRSLDFEKPDKTISIDGGFDQWDSVDTRYFGYDNDICHRNFCGTDPDAPNYTEQSARHDLCLAKVAADSENLYFYVQSANSFVPRRQDDQSYLLLYLNIGGNYEAGWNGYGFVAGRFFQNGKVSLEQYENGAWQHVAWLSAAQGENQFHLALPKRLVGYEGLVDFKWADNMPQNPDMMDFIDKGKAIPWGRFNFRFEK